MSLLGALSLSPFIILGLLVVFVAVVFYLYFIFRD